MSKKFVDQNRFLRNLGTVEDICARALGGAGGTHPAHDDHDDAAPGSTADKSNAAPGSTTGKSVTSQLGKGHGPKDGALAPVLPDEGPAPVCGLNKYISADHNLLWCSYCRTINI